MSMLVNIGIKGFYSSKKSHLLQEPNACPTELAWYGWRFFTKNVCAPYLNELAASYEPARMVMQL